ncbi:MAG: response regulator [Deltaproteobacteria bacterium]|nr:response regulator [Deltaproteobacteria bacterium]
MSTAKRILVVEDESLVAFDIEQGLERQGYSVTGVIDSGEQAVEHAGLYMPDLVLMDIRLRGDMDGIKAATEIQQKYQIPIIFLTAYGDESTLQRAMVAEPYGYILKPFDRTELRAAIEVALLRANLAKRGTRKIDSAMLEHKVQPLEPITAESGLKGKIQPFQFLSRVSPFSSLPEKELRVLASACQIQPLKAGELIAHEGDDDVPCFIVVSGRVALIKTSLNGKELIVQLLPPGDLFNLIMALKQDTAPLTARAQTDTDILRVPLSHFMMILDQHPEIYRIFVDQMAACLRASHDFARGLAHDRVEVRIASALCALVPRFASNQEEAYTIAMTRQEIADLTGTTPETAIRTTKAMERLAILNLERPGVIKISDLEGLQELAESE